MPGWRVEKCVVFESLARALLFHYDAASMSNSRELGLSFRLRLLVLFFLRWMAPTVSLSLVSSGIQAGTGQVYPPRPCADQAAPHQVG